MTNRVVTLLVAVLTLFVITACQIPGLSDPDDGPPVAVSEESAASLEQKLADVAAAGGPVSVTLTQEEVTSYLALKMPATIEQDGTTITNPLQNPQVYFKADGTLVMRANITFEGNSQLIRVVAKPTVTNGALQVDITEGKIGPVPVPGPLLDQVEVALAEGLTAGRDYSNLTNVAVAEGTITIDGTFGAQ
jgi:hypothetical protein